MNSLIKLRDAVLDAGFFVSEPEPMGRWTRIVLATKKDQAGLSGNSFWFSEIDGAWFVGTWPGRIYRAVDFLKLRAVALKYLSLLPGPIVGFEDVDCGEYGLTEIDNDEFEVLVSRSVSTVEPDLCEEISDMARVAATFQIADRRFVHGEWLEGQIVRLTTQESKGSPVLVFRIDTIQIGLNRFDRFTLTLQSLQKFFSSC